jgi:hypothetical protein
LDIIIVCGISKWKEYIQAIKMIALQFIICECL